MAIITKMVLRGIIIHGTIKRIKTEMAMVMPRTIKIGGIKTSKTKMATLTTTPTMPMVAARMVTVATRIDKTITEVETVRARGRISTVAIVKVGDPISKIVDSKSKETIQIQLEAIIIIEAEAGVLTKIVTARIITIVTRPLSLVVPQVVATIKDPTARLVAFRAQTTLLQAMLTT